jgi:hypothetical protein
MALQWPPTSSNSHRDLSIRPCLGPGRPRPRQVALLLLLEVGDIASAPPAVALVGPSEAEVASGSQLGPPPPLSRSPPPLSHSETFNVGCASRGAEAPAPTGPLLLVTSERARRPLPGLAPMPSAAPLPSPRRVWLPPRLRPLPPRLPLRLAGGEAGRAPTHWEPSSLAASEAESRTVASDGQTSWPLSLTGATPAPSLQPSTAKDPSLRASRTPGIAVVDMSLPRATRRE